MRGQKYKALFPSSSKLVWDYKNLDNKKKLNFYIPTKYEDMLQYLAHSIKRKSLKENISDPLKHSPQNPQKRVDADVRNFIKLFKEDVSLVDNQNEDREVRVIEFR